ncbi:MAG: FAD binding domain-containing protein, partial [Chloroflexota bacterium]
MHVNGDEGKVLAGGQSLMPLLNMRLAQPQVLIDLNRVNGLQYLRQEGSEESPSLAIGAMTRQRVIEDGAPETPHIPMLSEAISSVGH